MGRPRLLASCGFRVAIRAPSWRFRAVECRLECRLKCGLRVRAAEGPCRKAPPGGGGKFLTSRSRQRVVRSVRRFARDSEPHTARNATSAMARPAQRLRAWSVRTKGGGGAALGRPHKGRGVAASAHFCCECIWRLEVNGHPALSASPRSLFLLLKHTNRRYAKGRRTSWNR